MVTEICQTLQVVTAMSLNSVHEDMTSPHYDVIDNVCGTEILSVTDTRTDI